jgi:hypothetical protein
VLPETAHPSPLTLKVTAPVPDPPAVVRVMGVPAVPVNTVFEITSGAWVAALALGIAVAKNSKIETGIKESLAMLENTILSELGFGPI